VSLGEEFGYPAGSDVQGKMIGLLRTLGADYVLDTNFGADLTIMEEAEEFVKRFNMHDHLPQFTSCCPAWVKYVETYHHELLPNLSTAKSPIGMQGATVKTYFANKMGIDPRKIVHVALTPCTAKKMEVRRAGLGSAGEMLGIKGMRDTDYVITTRELAIWAKERNIDFDSVQDSTFDKYMGQSSGAGYIFANSGGVMEAALRAAYQLITHKRPPEKLYDLTEVRGYDSVKAASLIIQGTTINVAVIYGTANAEKFLKNMNKGGVEYHFIEVMTCPGGCIGGGGQPISENPDEVRKARQAAVYKYDELSELKTSRDNPEIKDVYSGFFDKPGSTTAQKLLHTTYCKRKVNLKTTPQ
jgi:ferredoxin hydrogenase